MPIVKKDIIYAKECFEIIGFAYDVWDAVGYGHKEKIYQSALAEIFRKNKKEFDEQLKVRIKMGEKDLGIYVLDFLYDKKIVIELKQGDVFSRQDFKQIYAYLRATNLKLGLLIHFTRTGVKFKRIVNLN